MSVVTAAVVIAGGYTALFATATVSSVASCLLRPLPTPPLLSVLASVLAAKVTPQTGRGGHGTIGVVRSGPIHSN